jgi:hypothetical protein
VEDYPRDLLEFEARFATEEACRDYLFALRWPEGFRCPGCGHGRAWPVHNRRTSRSRGKLFYRLAQAVAVDPTPYRSIVADWGAQAR